jgi:hypothetical protein
MVKEKGTACPLFYVSEYAFSEGSFLDKKAAITTKPEAT